MAAQDDYTTGTLTLTSGSASFTTSGSALQSAGIRAGDAIVAKGHFLVIATITGQNAGTLVAVCPAAAAGVGQALRIRFQPDASRLTASVAAQREVLADGKLASLAALTGAADKLPYLTGATTMALADFTAAGRALAGAANVAAQRTAMDVPSNAELGELDGAISTNETAIAVLGAAISANPIRQRNLVRNPAFDILQRGSYFTATGMTADGWKLLVWGTGGAGNIDVVIPSAAAMPFGARNMLTWGRTTAGSSLARLQQDIEGAHHLNNRVCTLCFVAYESSGGYTITTRVDQIFGTGGSPSATVTGAAKSHVLTNTPAIYYHKFTMPDTFGKTFGTNGDDSLRLIIDSAASGTFALRFLAVGLVEGDATSIADPFMFRPIAEELALCQRYYEIGDGHAGTFSGQVVSGNTYYSGTDYKVTKRKTPTLVLADAGGAASFPSTPGTPVASNTRGFVEGRLANASAYGLFRTTWTASAEW